jgi:long-subunit fatty acid transport protein
MVFGSIITNNNQSAFFIRLPVRHASLDLDATYYNPAGLTKLTNGFHLSLNNQTIDQEKTIKNTFPLFNDGTYIGTVKVPFFPTFFAVYKQDKLAVSFGFGPNAGGGSADYDRGLPAFEKDIAMIPSLLTAGGLPTTQYSADISFSGSSVYYGFQLNASFAVHEMFSLAAGARLIMAVNTYEGSIQNIMINPYHPLANPQANMLPASPFFNAIGNPVMAAATANKSVDAKQTASGFTPILSLNFTPMDTLTIAVRYEFNTKLEFTNETTVDDTGLFPDGFKFRNDIPALLAVGARFEIIPELRAHAAFTYYFDKNANWSGLENLIDDNTMDYGFGLEYDVLDAVTLSAGFLRTEIGVSTGYQSDQNHELTNTMIGFGARLNIVENLDIDLAGMFVDYSGASRPYVVVPFGTFEESYSRTTWGFAIGFNYHIVKK